MKIKTTEVTGKALDYAVAFAIGYEPIIRQSHSGYILLKDKKAAQLSDAKDYALDAFRPSADEDAGWAIIGPLMGPLKVSLIPHASGIWGAEIKPSNETGARETIRETVYQTGENGAVALCRVIVAAKFGGEFEIPAEVELKINGGPR